MVSDYIDLEWQTDLELAGLLEFDSLWQLELPPVDKPNLTRGGWSSVSRLNLPKKHGANRSVYFKRQINHKIRTFKHPIKGIPTVTKEFLNILRYQKYDIATLKPIYFAQRKTSKGTKAILITKALDDHIMLNKLVNSWQLPDGNQTRLNKEKIIEAIAKIISHLHNCGLQHNCLYAKHIFINPITNPVDVRLIDLEKSKKIPIRRRRQIRDLTSIYQNTYYWSAEDFQLFLEKYTLFQSKKTDSQWLFNKILIRQQAKS